MLIQYLLLCIAVVVPMPPIQLLANDFKVIPLPKPEGLLKTSALTAALKASTYDASGDFERFAAGIAVSDQLSRFFRRHDMIVTSKTIDSESLLIGKEIADFEIAKIESKLKSKQAYYISLFYKNADSGVMAKLSKTIESMIETKDGYEAVSKEITNLIKARTPLPRAK